MFNVFPHKLTTDTIEHNNTINICRKDMDDDVEAGEESDGDDEVGNRLKSSCHPIKITREKTRTKKQ